MALQSVAAGDADELEPAFVFFIRRRNRTDELFDALDGHLQQLAEQSRWHRVDRHDQHRLDRGGLATPFGWQARHQARPTTRSPYSSICAVDWPAATPSHRTASSPKVAAWP